MRPPERIDAVALLAAHGLIFPASQIPDRILLRRRPTMAADVRFALLTRLDPPAKPIVFPDINALARRIQRDRGLQGLDMEDVEDLELAARPEPTPAVKVWTTDVDGARDRFLGYAYVDGHDLEVLKAALRRNRLVVIEDAAA